MNPTTLANRPSGARAQKSTPSTTDGPAAGPSDQAKRRWPLCWSTLEVRLSTKPGKRACTPASIDLVPSDDVDLDDRVERDDRSAII